ncbi:MAG: hypothetical protein IJG68_01790 [Bacilli bacterium]|nr:hypothetical protein [Bacilli bacterium]
MIINNIIITITTLLLLKLFSMLVVLIFTIIYKIKAKGETDKELSYIEKQTNVYWGNGYGEWNLIPCINIAIANYFSISFSWLKFNYNNTWKVITFEEESIKADALRNNKT